MFYIVSKTATKDKAAQVSLLGITAKRDTARSEAKALGGVVRTQPEFFEAVADKKVTQASLARFKIVQPEEIEAAAEAAVAKAIPRAVAGALVDVAKHLAAATKTRTTLGKKDLTKKRPPTPQAVLDEAAAYLATGVKANANKVTLVRALAAWVSKDHFRLQRRDMFVVMADVEIARATISTQFQVVRSGKLLKNKPAA